MPDKVELYVNDMRIEDFESYNIAKSLFNADGIFTLELSDPEADIKAGSYCELYVDGERAFTGIVDIVNPFYRKGERKLILSGRDLMGIVVDSYCEEFITIEGMKLKALAERLLKNISFPFFDLKAIQYQDDIIGGLRKKRKSKGDIGSMDSAQKFSQIEPGMTVFEVLKEYAASRGMLFWCEDNGVLVFGRPKATGEPAYTLINRKGDGRENNILEGEMEENICKRYSKITVMGQQQGTDDTPASGVNIQAVRALKVPDEFPFYKPFVAVNNNDSLSPAMQARLIEEKQKAEGFSLRYKVAGHGQGNNLWKVNELCRVKDDIFKLDGTYLIYSCTFQLSKEEGMTSELRLGYPGMIQ